MLYFADSFQLTLPSDREIEIVRDFDAPRQLLFDAYTRPELVSRWLLGPDGWTMPVCDIDLRVGGTYRYVWRKEPAGTQMGISGVFLEVDAPHRLVATEKFDDAWYPGEAVNTTTFEDNGGRTRVRLRMLYQSKEARDTASRSGMEHGVIASYNRIEQILAERGADAVVG